MSQSEDDPGFEAMDVRLNKGLTKIHRERAGSKGDEFGHDQTYTPGYHEGGSRFGFFEAATTPPTPFPATDPNFAASTSARSNRHSSFEERFSATCETYVGVQAVRSALGPMSTEPTPPLPTLAPQGPRTDQGPNSP